MRARRAVLAILATVCPACGLLSDDDPASTPTVLPPATSTTTTTSTTMPRVALTYEAQLLDGGTLTITEDDGALSEFSQGRPAAILELDVLAAIPDCQQLGLRIWEWTAQVGPDDVGQKASAYAKHGDNLYKILGCGTPDEPLPPNAEPELDPRFDTCDEANDAGFANYRAGVDPEYEWYDDSDDDGVVCETGFDD